jgi:2',3'-cyclic-nucleotide 2'-phosphodiesterase (5'-nucleotidase family)
MSLLIFLFYPFLMIAKENNKIVIYHTNDMHGNINSIYKDGMLTQIGLDIVKSMKDSTPNSLLIDAGDALQGSPLGKYSKGLDIIKLMNAAAYDCMVLGNHEFDFGSEAVKECAKAADFPVISANVYEADELFLKDSCIGNGKEFIREIQGIKIGFFGITTGETTKTTIPENLENIEFKSELQTTKQEVEKLKSEGANLIIGVMHVGETSSGNIITSNEIARIVPGIDIIIDGHSHTKATKKINDTVISQTGVNSSNIGKIQIEFDDPQNISISSQILSAAEIGRDFSPDKSITKLYNELYSNFSGELEKVIGRTENVLYGGSYNGINISRLTETNLGDLICDAMMKEGKELLKDTPYSNLPMVAFENGGAVRSKIDAGYIKMIDVLNVLPLDNRLSVQIISPDKLFKMIERGIGKLKKAEGNNGKLTGLFGGFPQISGMRIEYDIENTPYNYETDKEGNRVTKISIFDELANKEVKELSREDDTSEIVLLCNDYTLYEFPSVMNEEIKYKGGYLSDILYKYILELTFKNHGKFNLPVNYQRVKIKRNNEHLENYSGKVLVKDSSGILRSRMIKIKLDGKTNAEVSTNENGILQIDNLDFGEHTIKLKYKDLSGDVYLNNELDVNNVPICLINNMDYNITNVSNIISQIPYDVTLESFNILKFARNSYDDLNDSEKSKVMNYHKLIKSEEKFLQIDNQQMFSSRKYNIGTVLSVSVLVAALMLYIIYRKIYKKNFNTVKIKNF